MSTLEYGLVIDPPFPFREISSLIKNCDSIRSLFECLGEDEMRERDG